MSVGMEVCSVRAASGVDELTHDGAALVSG